MSSVIPSTIPDQKKIGMVSLGCPKALVDSERILTQLRVEGYSIVPNYDDADVVVKDSNGQVLQDGDAVVLIKDLKVKGSSTVLKMGTKVKSIRLVGGDHEVDCKMDGGSFMLKACFLKKA